MRFILYLALVTVSIAGVEPETVPVPGDALVVMNGTVIDGTGRPPITDGMVIVQGDRIAAVGKATGYRVPEGATVIDAGGGTILPGIIDSHTHSTHEALVRRAFLTDGVTTVCNFRSPDMVSVIPVRFFQDRSSICPDFTGIETRWRKKADSFWSAPMSAKRAIIQGLWGYVRRSEFRGNGASQ